MNFDNGRRFKTKLCDIPFKTSVVEWLCVEANESSLENRHIKLGMQYATVKAYPSTTPAYDWVLILYVKMFMIIISYSPN
jgi:hypothetical protein